MSQNKGKLSFKTASFLRSCASPDQFPSLNSANPLIEFSIAGRSNVGKSSLINSLLGQKHLAKTSSTPGKTRLLNFFLIDNLFYLVDLPGYGFAEASKVEISTWLASIEMYFHTRPPHFPILILLDSRHKPTADDLSMIRWAVETNRKFLIVLTKADKLTQSQRAKQIPQIIDIVKEAVGHNAFPHTLFSIHEPKTKTLLIHKINELIEGAEEWGT